MRPGSLRVRLALIVLIVLIATLPAIVLALGAGFTRRRLIAQNARNVAAQVARPARAFLRRRSTACVIRSPARVRRGVASRVPAWA